MIIFLTVHLKPERWLWGRLHLLASFVPSKADTCIAEYKSVKSGSQKVSKDPRQNNLLTCLRHRQAFGFVDFPTERRSVRRLAEQKPYTGPTTGAIKIAITGSLITNSRSLAKYITAFNHSAA